MAAERLALDKEYTMIQVHQLTYNPFEENTYLLSDETKECVIIDPGCYFPEECEHLSAYVRQHALKPVQLWNTHCHLDHVFGNAFVAAEWGLELGMHALDVPTLKSASVAAELYGFPAFQPSPEPSYFIDEGTSLHVGKSPVKVLFGPGHSPGHIAFYSLEDNFVINGDILFRGAFGRYDLPGGDLNVLQRTIVEKMFRLDEGMKVYAGHGEETTIGEEKNTNPILSM